MGAEYDFGSKQCEKAFSSRLNLLKQYYLEVFNVEITDFFIKEIENKEKSIPKEIFQKENYACQGTHTYKIIICLKDKNKILFKNKMIKSEFVSDKAKEIVKSNLEDIKFIDFVDFAVNSYCKKYLKSDKDFDRVVAKNNDFQQKYQ